MLMVGMKSIRVTALHILGLLAAASVAQAAGWRGIVPLHSTCNDVKRVLGGDTCQASYRLEGEFVNITYSKHSCDSKGWNQLWDVTPGTVLGVERLLLAPRPFSEFVHDASKYRKSSSDFLDEALYENVEEGISLTVVNGMVRGVIYYPAAKDKHLRCKGAPKPKTATSDKVFPPSLFDDYGKLPVDAERQRLDAFARALQEYARDSQGYIVVYAGRRAREGEALAYAARAKEYVVTRHGIEKSRVGVVNGGHHEELRVELHIGPHGLPPPSTFPSLHPSEVEIIDEAPKTPGRKRRGGL